MLNRRKEEVRTRSSDDPNRCYKCGGVGHYSKVCPRKELALYVDDNTKEEVHGDQQTVDDEIVDPLQAPSDDDGEGEDNYLAIMRPSYSSYLLSPSPL